MCVNPLICLALAIEEANATFTNSSIGNVRLQFTHLYTMVDGLGPFGNVGKLRDEMRAAMVGLIIDNPTGCGLSRR